MMDSLLKRIEKNRKAHIRWLAMVLCLSMIVSLGTFAGFHKTAVAKTYTKEVLDCPFAQEGASPVAHVHNDDCYDGDTLVCTLPEREAHTHTEECFAEQRRLTCVLEENPGHQHGDTCYAAREEITCGLEENPGHVHNGTCFNDSGVLICTMAEGDGAHTHTADCFTTVYDLICDIPEGEGAHTHTDECYTTERVQVCGQEELPVHVHGPECIRTVEWNEGEDEPVVTDEPVESTVPEMPVSDPNADLESVEDWNREFENFELSGNWARDLILVAATQQGRGESPNNFEAFLNDAGDAWVRYGYTRYGAWYGVPYANEWSAMFVSFCLRYAGIPAENVPNNPTAAFMAESFQKGELFAGRDYVPAVGDLIFFDTVVDDDITNIDHMGIVYHVDAEDGTINTVEGDRTNAVATFGYHLDDEQIVGYGILPQNPNYIPAEEENTEDELDGLIVMTTDEEQPEETTVTENAAAPAAPMPAQSWERTAGGIKVSVEAPEGAFPENTTIAVTPVNGNRLKDTVSDAVSGEVLEVQAVDITFFDADGNEIEPAIPIRVTMTPAATQHAEEKTSVVHVDIAEQTAELIEQAAGTELDNSEVVFDADAFTIYAIVYTYQVEYEYEVDGKTFTSSMPGAENMTLTQIVEGLGIVDEAEIDTFVSKIVSIASSNEEVAIVTENNEIRVLKDGEAKIVITMQDGAKFHIDVRAEGETSTSNETATVSTKGDLYLPADAELKTEVLDEVKSENAIAAVEAKEGNADSNAAAAETAYQVFDISLENVEADQYDGFQVEVKLPEGVVGKNFHLYHVHGGKVDELELDNVAPDGETVLLESVSFVTPSFSEFVLSYTVDFEYVDDEGNTYTFSYPGKIEFNLSDMLSALHTDFTAADVSEITFTNNDLFAVTRIENDWIIEGVRPFTTVETMTLTLLNGAKYYIQVTDPESEPTVDLNIDSDNDGKSDAALDFTVDASNAVKVNEQERDASLSLNMHLELTDDAFAALQSASGFPTIVYDFTDYINNPDVPIAEILNRTQPLYDGDTKIGQVRFENNTMVMTITNLDWLSAQHRFDADYNVSIKIDEDKLGTRNEYEFQFPGTTKTLPIHFKQITFDSQKTVSYEGRNENGNVILTEGEDGKYRLTYTVTFNNPTELTSLNFTDTMTGKQNLEGDITVTGPDGSTGTVTGSGKNINIDVKNTLGVDTLPKGIYTVTYSTVIDKADLVTVGENGTPTTEKNAAKWKVNGDKDVTPDPVEITPYKDRPPMTVEKKVNDKTGKDQTGWEYGTELNYNITFGSEDKPMAGINIWDRMTDNQKLAGVITVNYKDKNGTAQSFTLSQDQIGAQASDTSYSTNQVNLFSINLPDDAGNGPVYVSYRTNIISKQEAIDNQIFATQSVYNMAGAENISSETEGKVTFPEKPEQKKEASAAQGTVNGNWKLGDTVTYTLTYGSKDIPLAGTHITDSMTKLQNLTGNITVTYADDTTETIPSSWTNLSNASDFSTEKGEVFDYTFPNSETRNGPVTITYHATLISEDQVRQLNISGNQNVVNTFTVNNNPVSTTRRIPTNEPNTVTKSVVNNTTPGNTWKPGDELSYTIVFDGDRLAGSKITDTATDIQTLKSDIVLTDSSNPANSITISKEDSAYIGSDFLDTAYSTNSKTLFEYTIPSNWTGPVTATYNMQIIDKTTAEDLHLYGLQGTNNNATTDRGGNSSTGKNTDFGDKPKIPQTKTVSREDVDTDGDEAYGWQPGVILNYTLTFGDANTKMAGYVLTDSMTNLQHLVVPQTENGNSSTGITVTYYLANGETTTIEMPSASISAATGANDYDTSLRQLFNYTLPADADKGVVTITYSTQVISLEKATELRIFGVQNVENRFIADGETVTTIGDVPFKPDPKPTKRVEPADSDVYITGNEENTTGWQPGQELTYTLTFGDEALLMNERNIWDGMTNTQTLVGNVTISWGTGTDAKSFVMPVSTDPYNGYGMCWGVTHQEGVFSNEEKTLFNYTLPSASAQMPGAETGVLVGEIYGPVTVTYHTKVMSQADADANHLYGTQPVNNTYTFNGQTATTTGDVPFVDQQTHLPAIRKTGFVDATDGHPVFPTYTGSTQVGERDLGNNITVYDPPEGAKTNIDLATGRVTWIMEVSAATGSVYPLTNVTVTDKLSQEQANVGSSYKSLADLYNMGLVKAVQAVVKTESGDTLTPGGDYTIEINGTNVNYQFPQIDEPTYIMLDIYFHEDVVGYYRMANFSFVNGDESTGKSAHIGGYNSKIAVTKQGSIVEGTNGRLVKWVVQLNPTRETLEKDVDEVNFSDILPDGMVLVNYSQALTGTIDTEHPSIDRKGGGNWNEWNTEPRSAAANERTSEIPVTVNNNIIEEVDVRGYNYNYSAHSGLSGTNYVITYYTWVTDEEWEKVTSSESGSKEYENTALFTTDEGTEYSQTSTVEIVEEDFIDKKDVSQGTLVEGKDYTRLESEDLDYIIDVNPNGYIMNEGNSLTLSDRIDTSMNLRVPSIRVFKVTPEAEAALAQDGYSEITSVNIKDNIGLLQTKYLGEDVTSSVDISYNDDTRMLTFEGIPDGQRYYVFYTAGVRSIGGTEAQTFTNTATLFGKGSYTVTETTQHIATEINASAHGGMAMMKIDENNIKKGLEGAVFELYKVETTDVVLTPVEKDGKISYTVAAAPGAEKTYRAVQITVGADENGQYISDKKGQIKFGSFEFEPNTLYYWVERRAPEGYTADLDVPHHFVLYNTVRDDHEQTQKNMMQAWALDDYWEDEYGIVVASYAVNATWYATNSQYRSITATKKWEGDSNNLYQLRPTDGVKLTLIRINADGSRTKLDTVTVRGGNETYWPSYTWNKLPVTDDNGYEYLYTVEEEPVTDYYAEYSDEGLGIKTGTVTIINRPTPGKTSVEVEKVWKTAGHVPDSIEVRLVQMNTDKEGNKYTIPQGQEEKLPAGMSTTAVLRPDANGKWTHMWTNLPTRDGQGGTYSYTVVEAGNLSEHYTVDYSDGGNGIVKGKITITNIEPGSLQIKKKVEVNGQPTNGTEADGTYTFNIIDSSGKTVKTVPITITNGETGVLTVDGLAEGVYTVREVMPGNGTAIASGTPKEYSLEVKAGKTAEGEIPVAEFTNNKNTNVLTVRKNWFINSTDWPINTEVTVRLMEVDGDGNQTAVSDREDASVVLNSEQQTYTWRDLDPDKQYTVAEDDLPGFVAEIGEIDNKQTITITNKEITQVSFQKQWAGVSPANFVAEVKLMQRERMIVEYGEAVRPVPDFSGEFTFTGQSQYITNTDLHSFDNLPKYRHDGASIYEIEYSIEEGQITIGGNDVTDQYAGVVTGSMAEGYIMTNTPVIDIPVEKIWDGGMPEDVASVEFTLKNGDNTATYADGTAVEPITLPIIDGDGREVWTAVFEDVPDDGNYSVQETKVTFTDGEEISDHSIIATIFGAVAEEKVFNGVQGKTITNKPETVDLPVTKTWSDAGTPMTWPEDVESITLQLTAGDPAKDLEGKTVTLTADDVVAGGNTYQTQFTGLPKYDRQGNLIVYGLKEVEVTSTNGSVYSSTITVNEEAGAVVSFSVANEKVEETQISVTKEWYGSDGTTSKVNTEGDTISFKVKRVVNGEVEDYTAITEDNLTVLPAGATVTVSNDGVVTMTYHDGWPTVTLNRLLKTVGGKDATYFVEETAYTPDQPEVDTTYKKGTGTASATAKDAACVEDTITIINTEQEQVLKVTKRWVASDGVTDITSQVDGKTIYFRTMVKPENGDPYAFGNTYSIVYDSEKHDYKPVEVDLPNEVYGNKNITWFFAECDQDGNNLNTSADVKIAFTNGTKVNINNPISYNATGTVVITNTLEPKPAQIEIKKVWMNGENDVTSEHTNDSITLQVYRVTSAVTGNGRFEIKNPYGSSSIPITLYSDNTNIQAGDIVEVKAGWIGNDNLNFNNVSVTSGDNTRSFIVGIDTVVSFQYNGDLTVSKISSQTVEPGTAAYGEPITLSASNHWYTKIDVPVSEGAASYSYYVLEAGENNVTYSFKDVDGNEHVFTPTEQSSDYAGTGGLITVTNTEEESGSLILKKLVSLNGNDPFTKEQATPTVADGAYTFKVVGPTSVEAAEQITKYVQITVTKGVAVSYKVADNQDFTGEDIVEGTGAWAKVSGLVEGDYVVSEQVPLNKAILIGAVRGDGETTAVTNAKEVTVHVSSNVAEPPQDSSAAATFTNTVFTMTSFKFNKIWLDPNGDVQTPASYQDWKENITVTIGRRVSNTVDDSFALKYTISKSGDTFTATLVNTESRLPQKENILTELTGSNSSNVFNFSLLPESLREFNDNNEPWEYYVVEDEVPLYVTKYGIATTNDSGTFYSEKDDAKDAKNGGVIINQTFGGYELPQTGGIGTSLFTALGGFMTTTAGAILTMKSYRRRKENT